MDKIEIHGGPAFATGDQKGMSTLDYFAAQIGAAFIQKGFGANAETAKVAYDFAALLVKEGQARAAKG